jgi:hypothetical protein
MNPYLQYGAQIYNKRVGLPPIVQGMYVPVYEAAGMAIANAYDDLPIYDFRNIETVIAYTHFAVEICQQFDFITQVLDINIEPWARPGQPYNTSSEMMIDVSDNMHLYVFAGGEDHMLLAHPQGSMWNINVKFRAVHDLFGHAAEGFQFGARGEENAWLVHSQMFTPLAQKAMTTETRGQNSWFNFGRHNYDQRGKRLSLLPPEKPFAVQKIALLPEAFTDWESVLTKFLAEQELPESNGSCPE